MDKIVFIVGKGKNAQFYKSEKKSISVGRALANDLVIADAYVDARQLEIKSINNELTISLLANTNPVLLNGSPIDQTCKAVSFGDEIVVGRTVFSINKEDDVVEPTQKLFMARQLYSGLWRFLLPALALILVFCASVLYDVLLSTEKMEWSYILRNAFLFCLVILFWSGLWGFVGRVIKHQHHFFSQLLFACGFALFFMIIEPVSEYLAYAFDNEYLMLWSSKFMTFVVCAGVLGFGLKMATNLQRSFRAAATLCFTVLGALWVFDYYDADEFSPYANYFSVIKTPIAVFVEPSSVEEYLDDVDGLFSLIEESYADD